MSLLLLVVCALMIHNNQNHGHPLLMGAEKTASSHPLLFRSIPSWHQRSLGLLPKLGEWKQVPKIFSYQRRKPEESILHQTLACHLNTFLANLAEEDQWLPKHVEKELWAYLECGILAYGFIRVQCDDCKNEQLVAFSCKKRGFCPSCWAKRMAETAAHLVENIIPSVQVRQYVLSVGL